MPNNVLTMTFPEPIPIGGTVSFKHGTDTILNTYVLSRSGAGEVTANGTVEKTASNLRTSLNLDYPDRFNIGYSGNQLTVVGRNQELEFSDGTSSHGVLFGYSEQSSLTVSGLSGNNYLINNDIILTLTSQNDTTYFNISFENLTNQKNTGEIKVYTPIASNTKKVYISSIIKSIFDYPQAVQTYGGVTTTLNTLNRIKITVTTEDGITYYETTKNFIRGGYRTQETNQVLPITNAAVFDTWLQPADKIPAWTGYPIAGYRLNNTTITKVATGALPTGMLDYQRTKGCNNIYLKFLNQKGGYSYWLFETNKETEANENLGGFIRNDVNDDLGNEANSSLSVWGKIPKQYIGLIKDLIISPEIYTYRDGEFERLRSNRNSITIDDNKRAYQVTIKFDLDYRFNPSLLWYN